MRLVKISVLTSIYFVNKKWKIRQAVSNSLKYHLFYFADSKNKFANAELSNSFENQKIQCEDCIQKI